jgi:glycosyltransferase involved in cell wall biosynthesis
MVDSPARIVHLITRLEMGGAQQNTLFCVEHHDRARFAPGLWAGAGGMLDARARTIADADVRILPWLTHPISPVSDLKAIGRLAAMLRDVDLIHTHSSKAGIVGRAAARVARVPAVVHTVHGWSFNDEQPPPVRRAFVELERAAARITDRIVCVSRSDRDRGLAAGIGHASQYRIVRSGIDPALYVPRAGARERVRAEILASAADVVVGSIANFKPQKGPLDLVEAARLAHRRNPRLRFLIAGDGELRPKAEREVRRAGLEGRVHFLGWREDVGDLLAAMDLFALTSRFEGLPRAVLQAIAASVPVVATDTGGVAEILEHGTTGWLAPPGRPGEFADLIVRVAADPEARAAAAIAARELLTEEFDIRRMVRVLEDLYEDLLEFRSRTASATPASHLGGPAAGR